jgi:hypothetical protein
LKHRRLDALTQDLIGQTELDEQIQRRGLQGGSTMILGWLGQTIEHSDAYASTRQRQTGHHANGAATGNQDMFFFAHCRLLLVGID